MKSTAHEKSAPSDKFDSQLGAEINHRRDDHKRLWKNFARTEEEICARDPTTLRTKSRALDVAGPGAEGSTCSFARKGKDLVDTTGKKQTDTHTEQKKVLSSVAIRKKTSAPSIPTWTPTVVLTRPLPV